MSTIVAHRLGEEGFGYFLRLISDIGVLSDGERHGWLELHRHVMFAVLEPLDDGNGCADQLLALARELGGELS